MSDSLLVYDDKNQLFRTVARWVALRSDGLTLVPWRTESARKFFVEQFGDHLFAFVMIDIDDGTVHAGSKTIEQVLAGQGAPERVKTVAKRAYAVAGDPVGKVLHGQRPADVSGSFPLKSGARAHAETLRTTCSVASCAERPASG